MIHFLDDKILFGLISVVFTFLSYFIYFKSIFKGKTKPHIFSWLIWGIISLIIFVMQLGDNAGIGALNTGFVAFLCLLIGFLSFKRGEWEITWQDKISFFLGLLSIVFWIFTDDPIISILLLIVIDIFGFIPTFFKSYKKPFEENGNAYLLASLGYGFSFLALSNITFITSGFVIVTFVCNFFLFLLIALRRHLINESIA